MLETKLDRSVNKSNIPEVIIDDDDDVTTADVSAAPTDAVTGIELFSLDILTCLACTIAE